MDRCTWNGSVEIVFLKPLPKTSIESRNIPSLTLILKKGLTVTKVFDALTVLFAIETHIYDKTHCPLALASVLHGMRSLD